MIKKLTLFLSVVTLAFALQNCDKPTTTNSDCNIVIGSPSKVEMDSLAAFIMRDTFTAANAIKDSRGFYYIIGLPGSGANPTVNSTVTVKYTGTLTDGTVFDQNQTGLLFQLSNLILGWQMGIPLIKKGGTITLYLPPSLGYGCGGSGAVPPNAILVFGINLVNVQ